jgi:hypothetical protein
MQYKTIALELLRQRPEVHDRLRASRTLLPTLELLAGELKARHEFWTGQLSRANPGGAGGQVAGEALELALAELQGRLRPESSTGETGPLSLDAAMAFLRRHTPPA